MLVSILLSIILLGISAHWFWSWWRLRHIPGPPLASFSLLWILRKALSGRYQEELKTVSDQYGPLARIGPNELLCTDPEVIKRMSAVRSTYTKGVFYKAGKVVPGEETLVSLRDEVQHKELRTKMTPAFADRSSMFEKGIDRQIQQFVRLIESKYISDLSSSASTGKGGCRPIDLAKTFQFLTLDVIGDISFSNAFGFLAQDRDLFDYNRINESALHIQNIAMSLPWLADLVFRWPFNLVLPKEGDSYGFGRLMGIVTNLINRRLESNDRSHNDMIDALIDSGMSHRDLVQMVFILLIAGSNATAYAMTTILLCLLTNPHAYNTLQREIDTAVANGAISSSPTLIATNTTAQPVVTDAQARNMPYLQATIHEGFRIFPPLAGLGSKQVPPDGDVIDGYFVPGGTQIGQNYYGLGRSKALWGEDADIFRPERWLNLPEAKEREMLGMLDLEFGHGKYQCLGKGIASMEFNKVFVELLRRFDMSLANAREPVKITNGSFMNATDLLVVVTKRDFSRG